ncbi:MAG: hypothetical protein BWX70_01436 [Verrucomicrobia bacterium ADurb.Bin070]|nr:MAG: hypothetical protein BWX70_01436 [Verrucomicrobia bacterium ADurb.Bin070]
MRAPELVEEKASPPFLPVKIFVPRCSSRVVVVALETGPSKITVPQPVRAQLPDAVIVSGPAKVNVRPDATSVLIVPPIDTGASKVRSRVAPARLMSVAAPPSRVSRALPPTVTGPPGFRILMPSHVAAVSSGAVFAALTVLFQTATSAAPGATPPTHDEPVLSASVLFSFTISPAHNGNPPAITAHTVAAKFLFMACLLFTMTIKNRS